MKILLIKIDNDLHKQLRIYAVNQDRIATDIVVKLVREYLEIKKSSHAEFGDRRDCSRTKIQKGLCIQFEYSMAFLENQQVLKKGRFYHE